MHLLPCPNCQSSISVSPSQAGDQTTCPECQASVAIPALGKLRHLPPPEQDSAAEPAKDSVSSTGAGVGFIVLGLIGVASLLVAGYCGIRWGLLDVPLNTDTHNVIIREEYDRVSAAELIRHYEQMEEHDLDLSGPYYYKTEQRDRNAWGRNASIAGVVGGVALLGAIAIAVSGRREKT